LKTTYTTHDYTRRCLKILVLFTLILSLPVLSHAVAKRVTILPFKINAEKDLSFLGDGILSMLSSRISWNDRVTVSDPGETATALKAIVPPLNESTARDIGNRLAADYVLFGSLTFLGKGMSIDVKVVDLSGDMTVHSFFKQSSDMDDIIPQINHLAEEINGKVFGKITAIQQPRKGVDKQSTLYTHPEQLMSGEAVDAQSQPVPAQQSKQAVPPARPAPMAPSVIGPTAQFWKSNGLDMRIRGLSLGDVTGDGKIETVVVSSQKLIVYRLDDRRFHKIEEIEGKKHLQYIAVDVADINQNNHAEIFVTALNANSGNLESFVLEWTGSNLVPITGIEKWYFRVQNDLKRGPLLLGQKRSHGDLFHGNVYELVWRGGAYQPQQKVQLPKGVNLFEFARGDVLSNGSSTTLVLADDDHLRVYSPSGEQQWESADPYSGSEHYLERTDNPEELGTDNPEELVYLPHRLLLADLNGDGEIEVILVNNQRSTGRYFKRFRRFKSGQIESLSWDGLGLTSRWQTRKLSGYISDYALQDIDNDGKVELVAAIVSQRGNLMKRAKSSIIAFDIESLNPGK
jgi:TolB-like protein